jgi:hypothetical protein
VGVARIGVETQATGAADDLRIRTDRANDGSMLVKTGTVAPLSDGTVAAAHGRTSGAKATSIP